MGLTRRPSRQVAFWRSWPCSAKACALGCVIAVIDDSFAKLRLFKITEFVSAAFLLAVLGVFTLYLGGG